MPEGAGELTGSGIHEGEASRQWLVCWRKGGPKVLFELNLLHIPNAPDPLKRVPYLIDSAHSRNGADVVGDGDEGGLRQVFLAHLLPLVLADHVAKTVQKETRGL